MWLKKSECKFSLLVLVFPCSSVDLFFEKINRNLNKKTNSNDGKQSSSLLMVWLCLVYLGLASSALSCIRFFLAHRVTICSRFSGTAPIRNILSCCQTMCRTMCPDIFMENVVSFRRIFSVSLTYFLFSNKPPSSNYAPNPNFFSIKIWRKLLCS